VYAAYCNGSKREITDIDILVKHKDLAKADSAPKNVDTEAYDTIAGSDLILMTR